MMKTAWLFPVLAVAGTINFHALADDAVHPSEIRRLVQQGRIVSLETILQQYPPETHGTLLDLEVEQEHGRILYELEFLDPQGRVRKYDIDAHTGRMLKREFD